MLIAAALAASTLATAPAAPAAHTYRGRTSEGGIVRVTTAGGVVRSASVIVGRYVCRPEGAIGPITATVRPAAPIAAGRFAFDAGTLPESMAMRGTFGRRGTLRGTVRAHGTIGTGDPCTSPTFRFTARLVRR